MDIIIIETKATEFVHSLNIHSNLAGCKYLIKAITFGVDSVINQRIQFNYKSTLARVAEEYSLDVKQIESNIRRTIDSSYAHYPDVYKNVLPSVGKPTPKKVIAYVVDIISIGIKREF